MGPKPHIVRGRQSRWPAAVLGALGLVAVLAGCTSAPRESLPVAAPSCPDQPTCRIRPVDARSLAELREFSPLDFGDRYVYAISPDHRRLALISWPADVIDVRGTLHIVDLRTWSELAPAQRVDGVVDHVIFALTSDSVYWLRSTKRQGNHQMPSAYELLQYHVGALHSDHVAWLPDAFVPRDSQVIAPGNRMAIYGIPSDDFFAVDVPHVLVVDLGTGRTVADISIPGLTDGLPRATGRSQASGPFYRQFTAGRAWDMARSRLYVVHPDADRISVVDLQRGVLVTMVTISRQVGFLDRLLRWLVVPAEAKMNPGLVRQAVVSPDGNRLYVTGVRNEVESKNGNMDFAQIPLGLSVIRLDTFTEERHFDLPVSEQALSPDGERLLLAGYKKEAQGDQQGSGLYVIDTLRLTQLAALEPGRTFTIEGFGPSGFAYISRRERTRPMFTVLDLRTLQLGAERELSGYWNGLISVVAFPR